MKCVALALVLWASLVFAASASAQVSPASGLLLNSEVPVVAEAVPTPDPAGYLPPALAEAIASSSSTNRSPVYGVLQDFDFQLYAGFTYIRFYELPGATGNLDGFNVSLVYYPHASHLGLDGEFMAAFAPQNGVGTTLDAGMGGGRFRVSGPRGIELWAHALAGGSHFSPKTPYGSEGAFAFEAGGGVDLTPSHRRFAVRVQGDLLGTYFFSTYQYNAKVSVGFVYKF
jgi:hypothetical protein